MYDVRVVIFCTYNKQKILENPRNPNLYATLLYGVIPALRSKLRSDIPIINSENSVHSRGWF